MRGIKKFMQILKTVKKMTAVILSAATCLTPGLFVSADGGDKAITIQMGSSNIKKLPLIYNDDYFNTSSFEYNESLATASLALELSGFANKSDYANQAVNAKKALNDLGFDDIKENDDYKRITESDTIGVLAANKKIKSNNEEYTLVPVVIRGGGYDNEWASNAKIGKTGDHEGFNMAATKAKQFVDDYIKEKHFQGKVKLWIVGYSRGGAVASLLGVKFDNDFTSTLKEINNDSKNCSNEDYYSNYVNKERERTLNKYGSEIEINPNDLYVYTFEAPMAMNIINGSGLNEYKGNIPYSKSQKDNRAIYKNVHNTVNDDDLIANIAPREWGFARPGVDHKLLEGRKSSDIATMENILKEFLVNKVSKAEWDKKSEEEKKKSKEYAVKYVGKKLENNKYKCGIHNYFEFSDRIIQLLNKSLDRMRTSNLNTSLRKKSNREFFVDKYQVIISKLAVAILSDRDKFEKVVKDMLQDYKWDLYALLGKALVNTNYLDKSFNNIVDVFSEKMKIDFSKEEKQAILDLLKSMDQFTELPFLFYGFINSSSILKMHDPEVHLATLISKDNKRDKYLEQMRKINGDYFGKGQEKISSDDFKDYEIINMDIDDEWEKLFDDTDVIKFTEESKQRENKLPVKDEFVDLEKEFSNNYGLFRANEFLNKRYEKEQTKKKGLFGKAMGMAGKGIKTGFRLVFSPVHETRNIAEATKDWASYHFGNWFGK